MNPCCFTLQLLATESFLFDERDGKLHLEVCSSLCRGLSFSMSTRGDENI